MKATMIRKASSAKGWLEDAGSIKELFGSEPQVVEVIIEKTINLSKAEFEEFNNDYFKERKIITDNLDSMYVDKNGVWHCIKITTENPKYSVLVESEGYAYARYTAIIVK